MTIRSTPEMRDVHSELIAEGRITRSAYEYAVKSNYSDAEIIARVDRARLTRANVAKQGAPLQFGQRTDVALRNENDPTPEWGAKAGRMLRTEVVGKGALVPLKRYKIRGVVEQYSEKIGITKVEALARYLQDWSYSQRVRVSNLNASGGASDPMGGLGDVKAYVRLGHNRHEWVLRHLSGEARKTARALVTCEVINPDGSHFSPEDFGATIYPGVEHKHRQWGLAMGALWVLAGQLVHLYGMCPIEARPIDDEERMLEVAR